MDIASIIESIGSLFGVFATVFTGWFAYNQYTKNKKTDFKLEQMRKHEAERYRKRNDNSILVYDALWHLLFDTKADRVYIVQPHPLGNEEMLTIHFEVKKRSAESMKPLIQDMKICEVAKFAGDLVKNLFLYITDINKQVSDRYAQSMFSACGTKHAIVKRLSDSHYDWVGSIFVEYHDEMPVSEEEARELLHNCATEIQYRLPRIEADEKY